MVLLNPSLKGVKAEKLNFCKAQVVSSMRRGWPSGLDVSHVINPLNPINTIMPPDFYRGD